METVMKGRPAKVLGPGDVRRILYATRRHRYAERDYLIVLLSVKAGLRAGEIAALTWSMVTDPAGDVSWFIDLPAGAAKKGSGRRIPLHSSLRRALEDLRRCTLRPHGPVILS